MPIADQINRDMTEAMKAKQMDRLNALRMMKTALKLRETELPGSMDDSEAMRVLQKLLNQRHDAAEQYRAAGRADRAEKEEQEARLIESYLPVPPTQEEIAAAIEAAVSESGASSIKDMGSVIKLARQKLEGKPIDGKLLSDQVKTRLGG
jgi:uncharacterized protein YqeY